jgi:hypothetical protein
MVCAAPGEDRVVGDQDRARRAPTGNRHQRHDDAEHRAAPGRAEHHAAQGDEHDVRGVGSDVREHRDERQHEGHPARRHPGQARPDRGGQQAALVRDRDAEHDDQRGAQRRERGEVLDQVTEDHLDPGTRDEVLRLDDLAVGRGGRADPGGGQDPADHREHDAEDREEQERVGQQVSRYLTLADNPRHLLLGPWDHGARIDISPWRDGESPEGGWWGELLRFFDHYLVGRATGLDAEAPIHYYALHAEQWRATDTWPPTDQPSTLHLAADNRLSGTAPRAGDSGEDTHQVDFGLGTGCDTRYERIAGVDSREYYTSWQGRTDKMLSYTSDPLPASVELVGHPIADLWISASEPDAALFVYLTEIEPDGTHRYVTEGLLRALHRRESAPPPNYRTTWPYRTFRREDAAPLTPGQPERIRIPLLPTAWRFATGSRIRLSVAGADADHCGQVPHGRPPALTLHRDELHNSLLELPSTNGQPEMAVQLGG